MKAGLAVRHLCWPSPSACCLAQIYRDTVVSKRTQASLEFAPVEDLAPVDSAPERRPMASSVQYAFFNNLGDEQKLKNGGMEIMK